MPLQVKAPPPKQPPEDQMTIEEFLAFTDSRPDDEKWELIEGEPIMSPSPVDYHQMVVTNILTLLMNHKIGTGATWHPMPGVGTHVPASKRSLPQPDVFVLEGAPTGTPTTADALVIFEVLSRSNSASDQAWRRKVYASVPNCQHYVTVSLKMREIIVFDRSAAWKPKKITQGEAGLTALALKLRIDDVYRFVPVGAGDVP
jgi:Uma2 family endonuclease